MKTDNKISKNNATKQKSENMRILNNLKRSQLAVCLLAATNLSACAIGPNPDTIKAPDFTTYPFEKVIKVRKQMPIPLGVIATSTVELKGKNTKEKVEYSPGEPVLRFDWDAVKAGDTAEKEIFVVPRNRGEFSEKMLMARVPEGGRMACKGDYRISRSKYFFGREATLKFANIKTPALRVIYRCPVIPRNIADAKARKLEQIARSFDDSAFFDISGQNYVTSKKTMLAKLRKYLALKRLPILNEGRSDADDYIIAGRRPTAQRWVRAEVVAALVSGSEHQARLTFKLFSYQMSRHKRGVAQSSRRGYARGWQPVDRKTAYNQSKVFLADFEVKSGLRRDAGSKSRNLAIATKSISNPTTATSTLSIHQLVSEAQCILFDLGYFPADAKISSTCDGKLGPNTKRAQDKFNKAHSENEIDLWNDLRASLKRLQRFSPKG